jgi:tellurite resistance protein TerC
MDIGIPDAWLWTGFVTFVVAMLALDLGVFHRNAHAVTRREALAWTAVWAGLAVVFAGVVWWLLGGAQAQEYLTGWVIEKSLSIDNLFVILMIFTALRIPAEDQHRVLFLGILTALVLRAAMIVGGAALLERFHWLVYVFGGLLLITGVRLWRHRRDAPDPDGGTATRWLRRILPATPRLHGHRFLVREAGRWVATPLLLALCAVELTDVAFAVDSIPAIFAVTSDPFIVFTSNAFAILGLRSLYFVLADLADRFRHLRTGLAAVLVYVGAKMVAAPWVKVPAGLSLAVILAILAIAVGWSILERRGAEGRGRGAEGVPRAGLREAQLRRVVRSRSG